MVVVRENKPKDIVRILNKTGLTGEVLVCLFDCVSFLVVFCSTVIFCHVYLALQCLLFDVSMSCSIMFVWLFSPPQIVIKRLCRNEELSIMRIERLTAAVAWSMWIDTVESELNPSEVPLIEQTVVVYICKKILSVLILFTNFMNYQQQTNYERSNKLTRNNTEFLCI